MLLLEKQQEEGVQVSENKQGHTVEGRKVGTSAGREEESHRLDCA